MIIAVVALAAWLHRRTRTRHSPPVIGDHVSPSETTTGVLLATALFTLTAGLVLAGTGLRTSEEAAATDRRPPLAANDLDDVLRRRT